MSEVDLGVDSSFPRNIKEVGGQRNRVPILLGDAVKSTEIHTETKGTVFLAREKDRSSARGIGGAYKTCSEILVKELSEGFKL
jgi:hypothetical protein